MWKIDFLTHNWGIKRAVNQKIAKNLDKLNGKVADFGCGTRPFEDSILQFAEQYVGIDWANSIHDTQADVIADLNKPLDIASESFDAVVSFEVLEHLCEPTVMLSEAHRVLKKEGGVILLSVPFQWWVHEAPWDYQRYTRYGLFYLFDKCGFVDIEVQETTGFWLLWILKLNYQLVRLVRGPRLLRYVIKAVLIPFWFVSQWLAIALDNYWTEKNETAGYVVLARKVA
ncbi:MAG: class I SAM-dependent methyltransferase [Moraxella sp.]|nr:class I SAM-dependent methyltransferase [Moraxella sp.]